MSYCCEEFQEELTRTCPSHSNPWSCPDILLIKSGQDYGIPIQDSGRSFRIISHCPWCGAKLTEF